MRDELSFCLVQIRNSDDPVKAHELDCFIRRLEVAPHQVESIDVFTDPLDGRIYDRYDAVLIGGSGEYSVLDDVPPIRRFLEFAGETATRGFPTFGSCFGFQAMSLALGGEVVHDVERAEVGTFEVGLTAQAEFDALFSDLPERFAAQQGHKDHVVRLPDLAHHLANSERSEYQAARFGDAPVWATQFHPELTLEDNRRRVYEYKDRYADNLEEVLKLFRPSQATHGLLARFADMLVEQGKSK
jgi:GMP synthase (glutamine-hydrolysing)